MNASNSFSRLLHLFSNKEAMTRFVELAGEINLAMPEYVVDTLARAVEAAPGEGAQWRAHSIAGARL